MPPQPGDFDWMGSDMDRPRYDDGETLKEKAKRFLESDVDYDPVTKRWSDKKPGWTRTTSMVAIVIIMAVLLAGAVGSFLGCDSPQRSTPDLAPSIDRPPHVAVPSNEHSIVVKRDTL